MSKLDTINGRLRQFRITQAKCSQEAFGKPVGLSRSEIKNIEYGKTVPKDYDITQLCAAHGINELWLRYGEGEMLAPKTREQEIHEIFGAALSRNPNAKGRILRAIASIPDDQMEILEEIVCKIAADIAKNPANSDHVRRSVRPHIATEPTVLKFAGRDGSFREYTLSPQELEALRQKLAELPDASDDL